VCVCYAKNITNTEQAPPRLEASALTTFSAASFVRETLEGRQRSLPLA
jgi:hypothetical protein